MTGRALEKITVVVTVAVLGVALAVSVRGPTAILLVAAVVITVSAGMDLVLRGETRYRPSRDLYILPAALVIGATAFLTLLSSGVAVVGGLAVLGVLLLAVLWAEHSVRAGLVQRRTGELVLTVVGYVAAFALYAAIYQSKSRSIISAPAILAVTFLLAMRQLRLGWAEVESEEAAAETPAEALPASVEPGSPLSVTESGLLRAVGDRRPLSDSALLRAAAIRAGQPAPPAGEAIGIAPSPPSGPPSGPPGGLAGGRGRQRAAAAGPRTLVYAALAALAAGEITWALNYWPLNGLFGGAFLLACFYCLVGVFTHHLQGRLTARLAAEYGSVAAAGALLIAIAGLMRRAA